MSNYYAITEESLTSIGDALRERLGETRMEEAELPREVMKVAKTSNAISHTEWNGTTSFGETARVTIEGASKLKIVISYAIPTITYVEIYKGTSMTAQTLIKKYDSGTDNTIKTDELIIEGNSTVIHYSNSLLQDGLGFYADVYGLDENGVVLSPTYIGEVEVKNTFKPSEMGPALESLPLAPPAEAFVITGDCTYRFANSGWDWFINQYGNQITTNAISSADHMFSYCKVSELLFNLNFINGGCPCGYLFSGSAFTRIPSIDFKHTTSYKSGSYLFNNCTKLAEIGKMTNYYSDNMNYLFASCYNLRYLPEMENWNFSRVQSYAYSNLSAIFQHCYSLRSIPESFLKELYGIQSSQYNLVTYNGFSNCVALDEIRGLRLTNYGASVTGNAFMYTFDNCYRLKDIIFDMEDGIRPYTCNWRNQTIDLANITGYMVMATTDYAGAAANTNICKYNSGITPDKAVYDDATYQALKDDPDWFAMKPEYSRYNHDSAVNTINSLPDVSAFGAGTNTIKFVGIAGSKTDGGAINTLTAEEIAVATAKGWTVTLK